MCDQRSDIALRWNILTPLEAQWSDKGGSKATNQQYQTDSSASDDGRPRVFTVCTSKISEFGGISSTCSQGLDVSDHTFMEKARLGWCFFLRLISESIPCLLLFWYLWHILPAIWIKSFSRGMQYTTPKHICTTTYCTGRCCLPQIKTTVICLSNWQ